MSPPKREAGATTTPARSHSSVTTDARNVSSAIVQGVKHPLRWFVELPFTVPRWLDRAAWWVAGRGKS